MFGPEHGDARGLQFHQRPHADASHDDAVHGLARQGGQGLTHAVRVVLVVVADGAADERLGVDDHERGRGAEVAGNAAIEAAVFETGMQICMMTSPWVNGYEVWCLAPCRGRRTRAPGVDSLCRTVGPSPGSGRCDPSGAAPWTGQASWWGRVLDHRAGPTISILRSTRLAATVCRARARIRA